MQVLRKGVAVDYLRGLCKSPGYPLAIGVSLTCSLHLLHMRKLWGVVSGKYLCRIPLYLFRDGIFSSAKKFMIVIFQVLKI